MEGVDVEGIGGGLEETQHEACESFEHVSKGSMLLKRMGWKEGQGLGRRSDGQLKPLQVGSRNFSGSEVLVAVTRRC